MKKPTMPPVSAELETSTEDHQLIAQRACELWHEAGEPTGHDLEFWLEAEAELRAIRGGVFRHPHRPTID